MKTLHSWLKVFKQEAEFREVGNYTELAKALTEDFKISGSFHSYNRQALGPKVAVMSGEFLELQYNPYCQTIRVGSGVKVKNIMVELLKHNRRLPNSGNYFEQTFVGAAIGGTHGFGKQASLADSIICFEAIFKSGDKLILKSIHDISKLRDPSLVAVTHATIKTLLIQSFKVTNCVCNLSNLAPTDNARAYAVLPYSDKEDPVCIIAEYEENHTVILNKDTPRKRSRPWKWWKVKLWWWVDCWIPPLRRYVQRALNFLKLKPFVIYTHPEDYDALYDPDVGLSGQRGNIQFTRWAYRPTYTSYNISLFLDPMDTRDAIAFIIAESDRIKRTLLRCFIGVRELSDTSAADYTGNAKGPVDAIDLYCSPKHAKHLIELQHRIQNKFNTRPHYGKTVFGRNIT